MKYLLKFHCMKMEYLLKFPDWIFIHVPLSSTYIQMFLHLNVCRG